VHTIRASSYALRQMYKCQSCSALKTSCVTPEQGPASSTGSRRSGFSYDTCKRTDPRPRIRRGERSLQPTVARRICTDHQSPGRPEQQTATYTPPGLSTRATSETTSAPRRADAAPAAFSCSVRGRLLAAFADLVRDAACPISTG